MSLLFRSNRPILPLGAALGPETAVFRLETPPPFGAGADPDAAGAEFRPAGASLRGAGAEFRRAGASLRGAGAEFRRAGASLHGAGAALRRPGAAPILSTEAPAAWSDAPLSSSGPPARRGCGTKVAQSLRDWRLSELRERTGHELRSNSATFAPCPEPRTQPA